MLSSGALAQAQNDIRFILGNGLNELSLVEFNRKNEFLKPHLRRGNFRRILSVMFSWR